MANVKITCNATDKASLQLVMMEPDNGAEICEALECRHYVPEDGGICEIKPDSDGRIFDCMESLIAWTVTDTDEIRIECGYGFFKALYEELSWRHLVTGSVYDNGKVVEYHVHTRQLVERIYWKIRAEV